MKKLQIPRSFSPRSRGYGRLGMTRGEGGREQQVLRSAQDDNL